jgi:hypothetical protein
MASEALFAVPSASVLFASGRGRLNDDSTIQRMRGNGAGPVGPRM